MPFSLGQGKLTKPNLDDCVTGAGQEVIEIKILCNINLNLIKLFSFVVSVRIFGYFNQSLTLDFTSRQRSQFERA